MIRLTVLYHDDTGEPVAVELRHREWFATPADSHAGINLAGGVYGSGPRKAVCVALLERERAYWAATKKKKDAEKAVGVKP